MRLFCLFFRVSGPFPQAFSESLTLVQAGTTLPVLRKPIRISLEDMIRHVLLTHAIAVSLQHDFAALQTNFVGLAVPSY